MNRFLKYVVETTLEGKRALIKEYVIALEVFDKSDAYDPREDSTVRTEASKLRARLSRYYEDEGREDPVIISVPKGGYVPDFKSRRDEIAGRLFDRTPAGSEQADCGGVGGGHRSGRDLLVFALATHAAAQTRSPDLVTGSGEAAKSFAGRLARGIFMEGRYLRQTGRSRAPPTDYEGSGDGLLAGLVSGRQPNRVCTE